MRALDLIAKATRTLDLPGTDRLVRLLHKSDALRASGKGYKTVARCGGYLYNIDTSSHIESILFFRGAYEKRIVNFASSFVSPGTVSVDVGANIGLFTLPFSRGQLVYSFEPEPRVFRKLKANLQLNKISNVHPLPYALSDQPGHATLHTFSDNNPNEGAASLYEGHSGYSTVPIPVQVKTLDAYNLPRVDFIKIDTEGNDMNVMLGAVQTITRCRPAILFEWHQPSWAEAGHTLEDAKRLLQPLGYNLREVTERGTAPYIDPERADIIALYDPKA
jgi:FkbM family methyltransferase